MQFIECIVFIAESTLAIYNLCKIVGQALREYDVQSALAEAKK